jgi:hypothetical protein
LQSPRKALKARSPRSLLVAGILAGLAYGLFARLMFDRKVSGNLIGIMSASFLLLVPFAIGFLCVYAGESKGRWSWGQRILVPWIAAGACMAAAICLAWEGAICIALWSPLFLILTTLGALAGGLTRDFLAPRSGRNLLAFCLIVPFLIAPVERRFPPAPELRTVATQIEIDAPPEVIWNQIERVPPILPAEQRRTLTQAMGFPRPIQATLSFEGPGAVRHASFEGNLVFIETVHTWQPGHRLAFSIRADTAAIPATTLDEHVTVGGPFFDVLDGDYSIELLAARRSILHLSSRHRLSTHFNFYAGLWTSFIMRDIQDNILHVIKNRCEAVERP